MYKTVKRAYGTIKVIVTTGLPYHIYVQLLDKATGNVVNFSHYPNTKKPLASYQPFKRYVPIYTEKDYKPGSLTKKATIQPYDVQPFEPLPYVEQQLEAKEIIAIKELSFSVGEGYDYTALVTKLTQNYYQLASTPYLERNNCVTLTTAVLAELHPLRDVAGMEKIVREITDTFIHPLTLMWYLDKHEELGTNHNDFKSVSQNHQTILNTYYPEYLVRVEFGEGIGEGLKQMIGKNAPSVHRKIYNEASYKASEGGTDAQVGAIVAKQTPVDLPKAYEALMKEYGTGKKA